MSRRRIEGPHARRPEPANGTPDPLRLCVYTTVALLTWLLGPAVVAALAGLGFAGYLRARRAGLTSSRCILRDIRLVLGYLAIVGVVALVAVAGQLRDLVT